MIDELVSLVSTAFRRSSVASFFSGSFSDEHKKKIHFAAAVDMEARGNSPKSNSGWGPLRQAIGVVIR